MQSSASLCFLVKSEWEGVATEHYYNKQKAKPTLAYPHPAAMIILMKTAILVGVVSVSLGLLPLSTLAQVGEQIKSKEADIAELNRQINELKGQRDDVATEAELIDQQLKKLTQELTKAELELKRTQLNIQTVNTESQNTAEKIEELKQTIETKRQHLRALFRLLYEKEQESFVSIFLRSASLSEVLAERSAYADVQTQTVALVNELQEIVGELAKQQADLEQQQADLSQLSRILAAQKSEITERRAAQNKFLAAKRAEQASFENLIADARQAREEIERDIFELKGAGVKLSLTAASDMAKLASQLTGVRAAVLMAVLKVESNLGNNLGGGTFPDDMHPLSREPFLRITAKLGLDPHTAPISARPKSFQGWGGAMGPAQIMPQTWEGIESRVSSLLGKAAANPYELTDAFVGTAVLLADRGAADPVHEFEAVNRYIAGPNWQRFTWYGDRVFAVAKEYEKQGL